MAVIELITLSHTGHHREHNEDAVWADAEQGLMVLADGMGGYHAGEVASGLLIERFEKHPEQGFDANAQSVQETLRERAKTGELEPMTGTTLVALKLTRRGYILGWAGDSRCYRLSSKGELKRLTRDHTFVQDMIERGTLTEAEAENSERKHLLTNAITGSDQDVRVDIQKAMCMESAIFLLCSDGLSGELSDQEMQTILNESREDLHQASQQLMDAALKKGGRDNISLILAQKKPLWSF